MHPVSGVGHPGMCSTLFLKSEIIMAGYDINRLKKCASYFSLPILSTSLASTRLSPVKVLFLQKTYPALSCKDEKSHRCGFLLHFGQKKSCPAPRKA